MRAPIATITVFSAASLTGVAAILLPAAAASATVVSGPDVISVPGTARDFRKDDSSLVAAGYSGPYGHIAFNVDLKLDADNRPVLSSDGFEVYDQWRNSDGRPIPPHLYYATRTIRLTDSPSINSGATVDTWDSSLGPYGGSNVGGEPRFDIGADMPEITEPPMGPSVGDVVYKGAGTSTLSTDLHCDMLAIRDLHTLKIDGPVTILCEGDFIMRDDGKLDLHDANSTLTVYVKGGINIQDSTIGSSEWRYWRVKIIQMTDQPVYFGDGSVVNAELIAPGSLTRIADASQFFGQITSGGLTVEDTSGVHIDGYDVDGCGVVIEDTPGLPGSTSTGGIASQTAFATWYRDTLGTNLSKTHDIILTRNASGIYEYLDDEFFPLDDALFGNEGMAHNFYFTYMFSIEFVHRACDGRFLEFEGADDAWAFVDGDLALDLGGIQAGTPQYVEFDRLDLNDGQVYRLYFFYAQRNPWSAVFRLRTNLEIIRPPIGSTASPVFD